MKKIFLLVLFCVNLYSYSQTHDHVYSYTRPRAHMYNGDSFTLNGFSSCQNGLIVTIPTFIATVFPNPCSVGNYLRVYVDDNLIASNLCQGSVVSVPPQFLPVTNIKIEFYHSGPGAPWSPYVELKTEITVTSPVASMPVTPNTSNINYCKNATATPLSAILVGTGTSLKWYAAQTGGLPSTTAPTPSTATVGTTSYWVSQADASGCESERVEIVVNVNAAATHLNFDGVNDYVSIAPGTLNNLIQGTIETWVYLNALDNQTICAKQSNSENSYAVLTVGGGHGESSPVTGRIFYKSKNGSAITSNTILTTGQWYHLAVTITSTQANLYLNGVLDNTVSGNFSVPNDLTVTATTLGAWLGDGGGQYLNGNLDEFRVWNYALNLADIQNTMNCEAQAQPELVAYYKFNQGCDNADNTAITTLIDETGTYNGTLSNFTLTGTTSNWQSGSPVTTGNTCATLSTSGFEAISSLKVYPNPSTGIFNIATQENVTVEVYDLVGKAIVKKAMTVGSNSIDISNYASGMYLLKATNASGKTNTYKIVKQ